MFEVKFDGISGFIGHCDSVNSLYDFLDRCGFSYEDIMRTCDFAQEGLVNSTYHSYDYGYVVTVLDDQDD